MGQLHTDVPFSIFALISDSIILCSIRYFMPGPFNRVSVGSE